MRTTWQPLALITLGLALVGCAAKIPATTQVVLLPLENGAMSAIKVTSDQQEQTLSEPYQRLVMQENAAPVVDRTTAEAVQQDFTPLFDTAPPKALHSVLFFQTGGTTLTPESQALLTQTLDDALRRSGAELIVTGHTDTKGSGASNDALSLRRAQQVREMYIQRGFPPERIEAVGRGERELAVPTPDETDEPHNRRVVILVR